MTAASADASGPGEGGPVPAPPPGFTEEPEAPGAEGAALLDETAEKLDAATAQLAAERARTEHRKAEEERWIPGERALDRSYEGSIEKGLADLPAEEAEAAARTAGAMAVAADADSQAVKSDAARIAASSPGSPGAAAAGQVAGEVAKLDEDAITEGLAVSQDALNAEAARKAKDAPGAQAAEDAAQADEGRVARDLAEADALRAKLEGRPVDDGSGLPPEPG